MPKNHLSKGVALLAQISSFGVELLNVLAGFTVFGVRLELDQSVLFIGANWS
jgi:hypothetical protein